MLHQRLMKTKSWKYTSRTWTDFKSQTQRIQIAFWYGGRYVSFWLVIDCFHKLKWVRYFHFQDHCETYPVLSSLARDYLACSASSCAAERTFSAAADVCSSGRGRLKPRTIERCVSSHMWLKEGIKPTGEFSKAHDVVTTYTNFSEKKSRQ